MSRPLVIGNGNLLVGLDRELSIRDLYWPYVGLHNHLSGNRARIGIWASGRFSWLRDPEWIIDLKYVPGSLATLVGARHPGLELSFTLTDCVHHREDILLRRFTFQNRSGEAREVRLFISHDFHIAETDIADTVFYNPFLDALVHYKRDTYLLMSASSETEGLFEYSTGVSGFMGAEGTWRDAEDGRLSMNLVAQGSVDSCLSTRATIRAGGESEMRAWLCAGHSLDGVTALQSQINEMGFDRLITQTSAYWTAWSDRGLGRVADLPDPIPQIFRRSLLTIRSNIDNRGAIIAANDSDIMETARAHYSYMWPRDGALVTATLDRLGYLDITRRFFEFCRGILPKDRGALLHKYLPDGNWGATWHPWVVGGTPEVPFQEDSTALVLWALNRHYQRNQDIEFLESLYETLLIPCADFITDFRDAGTGLPLPSYDLWEERRGVHAYTCGTVYGALKAAADLAKVFSDPRMSRYANAAEEVRAATLEHLWNEDAGRFARRLVVTESGYEQDVTVDSSLYALFAFGEFSAGDERIERTMRNVISRLWIQTDVGGIARYENDYYFRRRNDIENVPGNPWFVCTLWAAQWYIAHAVSRRDLTTGLELLLWAAQRALPSGILAEQLHPETGEPLSVAPLTWSHAEFVTTALDYADRYDQLPD